MQMGIALLRKKSAPEAAGQIEATACREPGLLEQQLRECLALMQQNQMLFDLETEPELIDQRVFEYQALQCRYSYLQRLARAAELRAIL